jgi:hypothetical protein
MSRHKETLPFKEYASSLTRYSDADQVQAKQYKSILESELGQAFYQRRFPTIGDAALGPLNPNLPKKLSQYEVRVEDKPVNVYKTFWQFKQPAGSIFTDWNSAGVSAVKEDMSVKNLPLNGTIQNPTLVLSNTNNIRNNFQNYGKEYLTTTNMLNAEAFANGVSFESGNTSPYRTGTTYEAEQILHGNFGEGNEDGDLYARQINPLRVDNPINLANVNISSWTYINPAFIVPSKNSKLQVFHEKLKYGLFELDSMKLTGKSCLTEEFGMIPQGFHKPVDVYNDTDEYPPVSNIEYYNKGQYHFNKDTEPYGPHAPPGTNMYCSANTNYVVMPRNYSPNLKEPNGKALDTSIQVSPGNNSLTLGAVMSPRLKEFIQEELYELNRDLVAMQIYNQSKKQYEIQLATWARNHPGTPLSEYKSPAKHYMTVIKTKCPDLFKPMKMHHRFHHHHHHKLPKNISTIDYYNNIGGKAKYTFIFNQQRNYGSLNQDHPELEIFIDHLSIFKFGGNHANHPEINGKVRIRELFKGHDIEIDKPGVFLLLPTMLSEDLFSVRENIPSKWASKTPINNVRNDCITGSDYSENATNCAFRDKAGKWQQKPEPGDTGANYVPNMFNDPNNLNNDIYNLYNFHAGTNMYNAPASF